MEKVAFLVENLTTFSTQNKGQCKMIFRGYALGTDRLLALNWYSKAHLQAETSLFINKLRSLSAGAPLRARSVYELREYISSAWWRALQDPTVMNPSSREGKKFRMRFALQCPELVVLG